MIRFENGIFALETEHLGYYMGTRGELMETLHFGRRLRPTADALAEKHATVYGCAIPYAGNDDLLHLCLEVSPTGKGDFRRTALELRLADGSDVVQLRFASHTIHQGSLPPEGLPGAHGAAETLELVFDSPQGITVRQFYGVYPDCDTFTRRTVVENRSGAPVHLSRCMSFQLDLPHTGYSLTTFPGAWARERQESTVPLGPGAVKFGSRTGTSSNLCNPFFLLSAPGCTEDAGRCYGFNLVWSGSHEGWAEVSSYSKTRIQAGIQSEGFGWTLQPGESFHTPEAVLSYSGFGKNGLSHHFHGFIRRHIVPPYWAEKERPILLNNWEATYFKFSEANLLSLAKKAAKLGMELFVLDDGWFGNRDSDTCALGDYSINAKKLPHGLDGLGKKITDLGLKFGLWFEPEMVSPDSDLYRTHPDWAVQVPGVSPSLGRNQLVLDLCRAEVRSYIIENVNRILTSAPISYVKWDMNRQLTDLYSPALPEQSRFSYEWVRGLYEIFDAVTRANPEVLFEGCSSGGNRFDLGVLCYMNQIWTSDDTDCYERMKIQTGTSYGYPLSTMGAHVSASPNHQTARTSPLESRFDVAAFGAFGYELDLNALSPAEEKIVAKQVAFYKEHRRLFQFGTFHRLRSPFHSEWCTWMVVSEDKREALVLDALARMEPNSETEPLLLKGLAPEICYQITVRPQFVDIRSFGGLINYVLPVKVNTEGFLVHAAANLYAMPTETESFQAYGDCLMEAGLRTKQRFAGTGYNADIRLMPDYSARIYHLKAIDSE